jgi:hypothetical protein
VQSRAYKVPATYLLLKAMCVQKAKAIAVRLSNATTLTLAGLVGADFLFASANLLFRHFMTPCRSRLIAAYLVMIVHLIHNNPLIDT